MRVHGGEALKGPWPLGDDPSGQEYHPWREQLKTVLRGEIRRSPGVKTGVEMERKTAGWC